MKIKQNRVTRVHRICEGVWENTLIQRASGSDSSYGYKGKNTVEHMNLNEYPKSLC
jgi:hypothetical protein